MGRAVQSALGVWDEKEWYRRQANAREQALSAGSEDAARRVLVRHARCVLRTYSTSFFMVTRFLPPDKRDQVELIYAGVRYPDEVVDTFPLSAKERRERLDAWETAYERALPMKGIRDALDAGVPPCVAGLAEVVRRNGIPPEHYRAFLQAMRQDIEGGYFCNLDDLIERYIYGSAVVVGYFLAYVYGAEHARDFPRALESARDLGIALQLTNFVRDVAEDHRRGRFYLPLDLFYAEGVEGTDVMDADQRDVLERVVRRVSAIAETLYARAEENLDAFASDSRIAIRACIDVYRKLNRRVGAESHSVLDRASVPLTEKFRALPRSKYWRLPVAYLRW